VTKAKWIKGVTFLLSFNFGNLVEVVDFYHDEFDGFGTIGAQAYPYDGPIDRGGSGTGRGRDDWSTLYRAPSPFDARGKDQYMISKRPHVYGSWTGWNVFNAGVANMLIWLVYLKYRIHDPLGGKPIVDPETGEPEKGMVMNYETNEMEEQVLRHPVKLGSWKDKIHAIIGVGLLFSAFWNVADGVDVFRWSWGIYSDKENAGFDLSAAMWWFTRVISVV